MIIKRKLYSESRKKLSFWDEDKLRSAVLERDSLLGKSINEKRLEKYKDPETYARKLNKDNASLLGGLTGSTVAGTLYIRDLINNEGLVTRKNSIKNALIGAGVGLGANYGYRKLSNPYPKDNSPKSIKKRRNAEKNLDILKVSAGKMSTDEFRDKWGKKD